jgi:2,3-bisphosphoglycerate-independent phosphoglycerate mutase
MPSLLELLQDLTRDNKTKMLLVVLDGLGGIPIPELNGQTELEAAKTPNLDDLAQRSSLGLIHPVLPGVTPGSSAGHLALFGYEPLEWVIGRGVLEALGTGFSLQPQDVAVRGNFATLAYQNGNPVIIDRRAGRPATTETANICARLQDAIRQINGVEVIIRPVKEHRFVAIFRGANLDARLSDTDPQKEGVAPLSVRSLTQAAEPTAEIAAEFIRQAAAALGEEKKINYPLLRGFSQLPNLPSLANLYGLKAVAIAVYPMYRGLASLVGMEVLDCSGETIEAELNILKDHWSDFDYFFLHIKGTDSKGEDGNYQGKMAVLEDFDRQLPHILSLKPDVLVITGDHSTPARLKSHSWHPVPFLLHSPFVRCDHDVSGFNELACRRGSLGNFRAVYTMSLMLAHAGRLDKFSA